MHNCRAAIIVSAVVGYLFDPRIFGGGGAAVLGVCCMCVRFICVYAFCASGRQIGDRVVLAIAAAPDRLPLMGGARKRE